MTNGIFGKAANAVWRQRKTAPSDIGRAYLALCLRLENISVLRRTLGPRLLEKLLNDIRLKLVRELGFQAFPLTKGAHEICGWLPGRRPSAAPSIALRLEALCQHRYELPGMMLRPVINVVLVYSDSTAHEPVELADYARQMISSCSPLSEAGQVRFIEYPNWDSDPVQLAEPHFLPEHLQIRFQPQVCCDTGAVVAMRAFAQLWTERAGLLDLEDILPRLDDGDLADVTTQVLRKSLTAVAGWDNIVAHPPRLTLALTERELETERIAELILWELDRCDVHPARLELELSDGIGALGGMIAVTENLLRLRDAGCMITLGSIGATNTALAALRRFDVTRLRFGREFVAGCDHRADQQKMILAILALAEHLGLETLADGVSSTAEHAFLAQIGVGAVQGNAVAPVLTPSGAEQFLIHHDQSRLLPAIQKREA